MPRRNDNNFHERSPHPDGKYESIISETTASAGTEMGIRSDMNPENFNQPKNPFHYKPKEDPEMERFQKFFKK